MSDPLSVVAVVVTFAALITVQVTIAVGLLRRPPRWRGAVAFAVPPLAPYWAFREGMHVRAWMWVGAVFCYGVARVI